MRSCNGIRMAGTPSFCTKRWVFSETLEKYTSRAGRGRRVHHTPTAGVGLGGQRRLGQRLDAVGPEAGPVLAVGDHDGGLQVTQRHDIVTGLRHLGDVDDVVGQPCLSSAL